MLFDDAILHVVRISRILNTPRGSALLVGVGGSGKQSLTRLASFIAGNYTFQLSTNKSYGVANMLEDLKKVYKMAGAQGTRVTFIITDNDIRNEYFLDYVNQILLSGEIPNLFQKDELDLLINELRASIKNDSVGYDSWDKLYQLFLDRVRDNLHIVLCFSPGEKFRSRARKFPGLISSCTIDWFLAWPEAALESVASKYMANFGITCDAEVKSQLVKLMASSHKAVERAAGDYLHKYRRFVYVTPKSYLSFIQSYKEIYTKKQAEIGELVKKVGNGLGKLLKAGEDVVKMKEHLQEKEAELLEAQKLSAQLLASITEATAKAEKKKADITMVKNQLAENASMVEDDHSEKEREFNLIKPELEKAKV